MYERVLVTGGAGFAGSHVALALKRSDPGVHVTALDNLRRRGSELNLPRLAQGGVQFVQGDVRSLEDLLALRKLPQLIVECSAEPSAQAGYSGSPEYVMRTNLEGCFHCLELARRAQADFLFVSTSRVYPFRLINDLAFVENDTRFALAARQTIRGASQCGINEDFPLDGARSLYGMTKLASELMVEEYADAYGIRYVIDRCGLLAGPRQMGKSDQGVVALWMAAHYFSRALSYIGFGGTGKQVRDVLHIQDFCELVLEQVKDFDKYSGQRFNVGGGEAFSLSLREMTELCREITGNTIPIEAVAENRPADVRIYITDPDRISAVNGWRPKRNARETLRDIFEWMRAEENLVRPVLLTTMNS